MEGKVEPGLPPGWERVVTAGQLMWARSDGTTATSEYEPMGGQDRRHIVIVRGGNGYRLPYDEVAEIAAILSHSVPLALVPPIFRNGGPDTVVLVETSDQTLADIWDAVARVAGEDKRVRKDDDSDCGV